MSSSRGGRAVRRAAALGLATCLRLAPRPCPKKDRVLSPFPDEHRVAMAAVYPQASDRVLSQIRADRSRGRKSREGVGPIGLPPLSKLR